MGGGGGEGRPWPPLIPCGQSGLATCEDLLMEKQGGGSVLVTASFDSRWGVASSTLGPQGSRATMAEERLGSGRGRWRGSLAAFHGPPAAGRGTGGGLQLPPWGRTQQGEDTGDGQEGSVSGAWDPGH